MEAAGAWLLYCGGICFRRHRLLLLASVAKAPAVSQKMMSCHPRSWFVSKNLRVLPSLVAAISFRDEESPDLPLSRSSAHYDLCLQIARNYHTCTTFLQRCILPCVVVGRISSQPHRRRLPLLAMDCRDDVCISQPKPCHSPDCRVDNVQCRSAPLQQDEFTGRVAQCR
jgi:hypothetical protein